MPGIEAFNLIHAGASVLGQVEDVDLTVAQNNSHANRSMTEAVDATVGVGHGIVLQAGSFQQQIELALKDACRCCAIGIVGQEDVVVSTSIRISLSRPLVGSHSP